MTRIEHRYAKVKKTYPSWTEEPENSDREHYGKKCIGNIHELNMKIFLQKLEKWNK